MCQSKVDELFLRFNGIIDQIKNLLFSILSLLSPFEVKTLLYFLGTLCISFGDCSDPSCLPLQKISTSFQIMISKDSSKTFKENANVFQDSKVITAQFLNYN